ncbi:MAG TPA: response regulator [Planctomycetota bacterium]|nr:response regulator [Planctomycetota bacterium]
MKTIVPAVARRVLVVDPSPEGRERCIRILEEVGYEAQSATSVREALRTLAEEPCGTVLVEERLPDAPGMSLVRWMRRYKPEVAVIVYSGGADWDLYERARRAGARDVVSKLSPPAELVRSVGRRPAPESR